MAIISANRLSKLNGNYVFAANESYGVEDIGRIMMENEMNDMAIFNAALKSDMYELQCRTEGTLLESELQSLSENAVQDFFKSIIEKLKKFWEKMKGLFKKAYAMISAYVVRNGKAFIAANRKELSKLTGSEKIPGKVYCVEGKPRIEQVANFKAISPDDAKNKVNGMGESSNEITKYCIGRILNDDNIGDKKVLDYLKDKCFKPVENGTLSQCGGAATLMADLENGIEELKTVKKTEKDAEKTIKDAIKKLENEARNAAKDLEGTAKDEKTKEANYYKIACTGMTNALSTTIRAVIRLVRFRLAQERIILAKAIGSRNTKTEATLFESMLLEAAEDIETMEDDVAEEESPEVAEAIETVLDAVEDALEREEGGSDIGADESCRNC